LPQNQTVPQSSESLNVSHLKQLTDKNPNLKAELVGILSQTNISDHRKGELITAFLDKKKFTDQQHSGGS
jgi:hypothetical protein